MMKLPLLVRLGALLTLACVPAQAEIWLPGGADDFASATVLADHDEMHSLSNLTGYTLEAEEPGHLPGGLAGDGRTAWYLWTPEESGLCSVDTLRSSDADAPVKNTALAVYTGESLEELTLVVANDDDPDSVNGAGLPTNLSRVSFFAEAGTAYRIVVDSVSDEITQPHRYEVALRLRQWVVKKQQREGLWQVPDTPGETGKVTLTLTAKGRLTGKLMLGGKAHAFRGTPSENGIFTVEIERRDNPHAWPVAMSLDLVSGWMTVNLFGGSAGFDRQVEIPLRMVFSRQTPCEEEGQYTAYMQSISTTLGTGTMSASIKKTGAVRGAGTAPDGTGYTFSAALHERLSGDKERVFFVHVPLYARKGVLMLQVELNGNEERNELSLSGYQMKPPPRSAKAPFYPDGFNAILTGTGSRYFPPAKGQRAEGFLDATDGVGDLYVPVVWTPPVEQEFSERLMLTPNNKFVFDSRARKPVLKLNAKTGLLTGSLMVAPREKRQIRAVIVTTVNTGTVVWGVMTVRGRTMEVRVETP